MTKEYKVVAIMTREVVACFEDDGEMDLVDQALEALEIGHGASADDEFSDLEIKEIGENES